MSEVSIEKVLEQTQKRLSSAILELTVKDALIKSLEEELESLRPLQEIEGGEKIEE